MDRVSVDLQHCYGIRKLSHAFDFSKVRAYALYAPNGVMKSSLAQTFQDVADGRKPIDRIFQDRESVCHITDETGAELKAEQVFVIGPFNKSLSPNEKTSTLLVDAKLRAEFANLYAGVEEAENALIAAVGKQAKSKKRDFEKEISSAFTPGRPLETALMRIQGELAKQTETPFANVEYDRIFDDKVLDALADKKVRGVIEEYVLRYNELLAASTFFKKGTFDYYNATQIATNLANNGFFNAKHTVRLNSAGESIEVSTKKELEAVITREKEAILKDQQLRAKFDAIATVFDKNVTLRGFRSYMLENEAYLSQLSNVAKFREDILSSYLRVHYDLYLDLVGKYEAAAESKKRIEKEAEKQFTQWEQVIDSFNDRFVVPFSLEAKNRVAVMTGQERLPQLGFTYHEGDEKVVIERDSLLESLSTGERKAFYILNVLFEIETRKKLGQETIVIVDDLADSFDYQNKYAIIQYLKDISEDGLFKQIIMTHNFDFFRTIEGRFVGRQNCLMASRGVGKELTLTKAFDIRNIFARDWKKNFFVDSRKKLACVPFLRNLVEYSEGSKAPNYLRLTSILHWKLDTALMTVGDLDQIYNDICKTSNASTNPEKLIADLVEEEVKLCLDAPTGANFENKIVLAMAIRLHADRFMVAKLNDDAFVAAIKRNQTTELFKEFKKRFKDEKRIIATIDRVLLMTPENLHLNAFMYEPIVDMSDHALKDLYRSVAKLV